jgi:hypothetical protein
MTLLQKLHDKLREIEESREKHDNDMDTSILLVFFREENGRENIVAFH